MSFARSRRRPSCGGGFASLRATSQPAHGQRGGGGPREALGRGTGWGASGPCYGGADQEVVEQTRKMLELLGTTIAPPPQAATTPAAGLRTKCGDGPAPARSPPGYTGFRGPFEGDELEEDSPVAAPEVAIPGVPSSRELVARGDGGCLREAAAPPPAVRFRSAISGDPSPRELVTRGDGPAGAGGRHAPQAASAEALAVEALAAPPPAPRRPPVATTGPGRVARCSARRRPPSAPAQQSYPGRPEDESPQLGFRSSLHARGDHVSPAAAQARRLALQGKRR